MLYVIFEKDECPRLPLYLYVWFGASVIYRGIENIWHNLKHIEFGDTINSLKRVVTNIVSFWRHMGKEYKLLYREKVDTYLAFINNSK